MFKLQMIANNKMLQIINIIAVNVIFDSIHERIKCDKNRFLYRTFFWMLMRKRWYHFRYTVYFRDFQRMILIWRKDKRYRFLWNANDFGLKVEQIEWTKIFKRNLNWFFFRTGCGFWSSSFKNHKNLCGRHFHANEC